MMRSFLFTCLFCLASTLVAQKHLDAEAQLNASVKQYLQMLEVMQDTSAFPQSVNPDGTLRTRNSAWWCSGFFGASLWYLAEFTGDSILRAGAKKWTAAVEKEKYNTSTHDLGFMIYCPFGNAYRNTGDTNYLKVMLQAAESLSTRFDPKRGVIKSWNDFGDCRYPVIIDNMMNLELLFWASEYSGNPKFADIAVTHAKKTLDNHFREDGSSYHVLCYDETGNVVDRKTAQGYADASAWARGQAWGLYGFTIAYRWTNDQRFLEHACRIADFFIQHPNMPEDKIPYWDFNAPEIPNEVRDASSAAIAASALIELSTMTPVKKKEREYFDAAEKILQSLSSPDYFALEGNHHFLLKHSTGHKPANSEVDTPIIYADYYYLEALMRYYSITVR